MSGDKLVTQTQGLQTPKSHIPAVPEDMDPPTTNDGMILTVQTFLYFYLSCLLCVNFRIQGIITPLGYLLFVEFLHTLDT